MAKLGITPPDLYRLQVAIDPLIPKVFGTQVTTIRSLYYEVNERIFDYVDAVLRGEQPLEKPSVIDKNIAKTLRDLRTILAVTKGRAIEQDIPVY